MWLVCLLINLAAVGSSIYFNTWYYIPMSGGLAIYSLVMLVKSHDRDRS